MHLKELLSKDIWQILHQICFVSGFLSIIASIAVWYLASNGMYPWPQSDQPHGERFGIFIGLWAPTFFILSQQFESYTKN
jgi:hypothetical protein